MIALFRREVLPLLAALRRFSHVRGAHPQRHHCQLSHHVAMHLEKHQMLVSTVNFFPGPLSRLQSQSKSLLLNPSLLRLCLLPNHRILFMTTTTPRRSRYSPHTTQMSPSDQSLCGTSHRVSCTRELFCHPITISRLWAQIPSYPFRLLMSSANPLLQKHHRHLWWTHLALPLLDHGLAVALRRQQV